MQVRNKYKRFLFFKFRKKRDNGAAGCLTSDEKYPAGTEKGSELARGPLRLETSTWSPKLAFPYTSTTWTPPDHTLAGCHCPIG